MKIHFPVPTDITDDSCEYYLSHNDLLLLYNTDYTFEQGNGVTSEVIKWIELESTRWGWKSIRWGIKDNLRYCYLRTHRELLPTVKYCQQVLLNQSILEILTSSITRIAQHACRQGEISSRVWPTLYSLPEPECWRMVGKQYAHEIARKIEERYLTREDFLSEIAKAKEE
jgi:hypothetical protein